MERLKRFWAKNYAWPTLFAAARVALHLASFFRYGYFRDELYYIACSKHLAWGYVDQPPFSIFILKGVRFLFGDSLFAIRLLPLLAGIATIYLAGFMAKKLGGSRLAMGLAAFAALNSPVLLGNSGRYFSMNAFDILFWTLAAYLLIRIIVEDRPKLWLPLGIVAGLGLINKYSMGFFLFGLGIGLLLTPQRKQFRSKWLYIGGGIALFIFLPHLLWEIGKNFPSLEFMHNAAIHKNIVTTPLDFSLGQLREAGFVNTPIWIMGFMFFLFFRSGRPFRFFAYTYAAIFLVMAFQNGKPYYLSPFFPLLFASGAVGFEIVVHKKWKWLKPAMIALMVVGGVVNKPFTLPLMSVQKYIQYQKFLGEKPRQSERSQIGILPQHYADQMGWEELTKVVASAFQRLIVEERSDCVIILRNYGEAGAIDFFGPKFGLPRAVCGHNSYWYWGYGEWRGKAAIVMGSSASVDESRRDLEQVFEQVELAAVTACPLAMPYENSRPIFICRTFRLSLAASWAKARFFI